MTDHSSPFLHLFAIILEYSFPTSQSFFPNYSLMPGYEFRCRICSFTLFDETLVIHPDQSCFSTAKNCIHSLPSGTNTQTSGIESTDASRNRFESAPKDFPKLYRHGRFERSDAHIEWEDVEGNDAESPQEVPLESTHYQTDFTKDTAREKAPAYRKTCTSIFISADEVDAAQTEFTAHLSEHMESIGSNGRTAGEIDCPRCTARGRSTRLGKFALCGAQCSCGKWITPALQFISSKIDIRQRDSVLPM